MDPSNLRGHCRPEAAGAAITRATSSIRLFPVGQTVCSLELDPWYCEAVHERLATNSTLLIASNGKRFAILELRDGPCGKGSVLDGFECNNEEKQIRVGAPVSPQAQGQHQSTNL